MTAPLSPPRAGPAQAAGAAVSWGLGCGLLWLGMPRGAAGVLGAAPSTWLVTAAATLVGLGLGGLLQRKAGRTGTIRQSWAPLAAVALAPAVWWLVVDPGLPVIGRGLAAGGLRPDLLTAVVALASAGLGALAGGMRPGDEHNSGVPPLGPGGPPSGSPRGAQVGIPRGAPGLQAIAAVAGAGAAVALPPPLAVLLAGPALALPTLLRADAGSGQAGHSPPSADGHPGPAGHDASPQPTDTTAAEGAEPTTAAVLPTRPAPTASRSLVAVRALGVALGAAVALPLFLAVRVPTDPSPRLLGLGLVVALGSHLLGRRLAPQRLHPREGLVIVGLIAGLLSLGGPVLMGVVRLSVQPVGAGPEWLPRLWLVDLPGLAAAGLGGGLTGLLSGPTRTRLVLLSWALAAGLVLGLLGSGASWPLWEGVAGVLAALLLLAGGARGAAGGTLVAAVLGGAIVRGGLPPADALATGLARSLRGVEVWDRDHRWRQSLTSLAATWGAGPAATARVPLGAEAQASAASRLQSEIEVEGRVSLLGGRSAGAEALAGHLGALLAPRRDRVLLLGDTAGNAFAAMSQHPVDGIEIATPAPLAVRAVATMDPEREAAWLAPQVRLRPIHPELALRSSAEPAAIVEIFRAPWADAARSAPDAAHFRTVSRLLGDFGIYVACVHLDAWPERGPAHTAAALAESFETVQLWLPPEGADSLLIVASQRPIPARRLQQRFAEIAEPRRILKVSRAEELAALAIGDRESLDAWAADAAPVSTDQLSPALLRPPLLHLGALARHVAPFARTWDLDQSELSRVLMQSQLDVRQSFLELLEQAVRGDMSSAFQTARALQPRPGEGPGPLAVITAPKLDKARAALAEAVQEGPSSPQWGVAANLAGTVRVLTPTAPEPLLILGEISLAQGDLTEAQEHFERALELDEDNLGALTGLARVARARKAPEEAEAQLRRAVAARPQDWRTWQNLGTFLMEGGRPDDAADALGRAVGLVEGAHPSPNLAMAELQLALGHPSAALVHAQRAQVIQGTGYGHYLLGRAHYDMDRLSEAESAFRQAVLADPSLVAARGAIGMIRAQKGDLEAAANQFRAVLQIDPDNQQARENLDRVRVRMERRSAPPPPG